MLCVGFWILFFLAGIYDLATTGNYSNIFMLSGLAFFLVAVYKLSPDDGRARLIHFLRHSLRFQQYIRNITFLNDEYEKMRIRKIHQETVGTPFPKIVKRKFVHKTEAEIKKQQEEALKIAQQPIRSVHISEETELLEKGENVEVTDSWKLNSLKKATHFWYGRVIKVVVTPGEGRIDIECRIPNAHKGMLRTREKFYRFKQDVYDFLQAVESEEWMFPYFKFANVVKVICGGVEEDGFGERVDFTILTVEIALDELKKREGKFFDVGTLEEIAKVELGKWEME
jgi:hypothetical protein